MDTNVTFKRRKLVSVKRIGGLYHWRIGALGGSVYLAQTRKRPRYSYVHCGNCIDIMDNRTGRTVAFLNIGTGSARHAFDAWLAQDRALGAHLTRAAEFVALGCIAAMVAISAIL